MEGFLDYLTREMESTFRRGKQIWGQEGNEALKRKLVLDAVNRAFILYGVARNEMEITKK